MVNVPLYDSLGPDARGFVISECEMRIIVAFDEVTLLYRDQKVWFIKSENAVKFAEHPEFSACLSESDCDCARREATPCGGG